MVEEVAPSDKEGRGSMGLATKGRADQRWDARVQHGVGLETPGRKKINRKARSSNDAERDKKVVLI